MSDPTQPSPLHRHRIDLNLVRVGTRLRTDYGDLDELAASILKFGLLQPICINPEGDLIFGGRRYFAHLILRDLGHEEYSQIDFIEKFTASQSDLREMELEENFKRKDMTWQEYVLGVREIHLIKKQQGALQGETWEQQHTAIAIGVSRQRVGQLLPVAKELYDNPNGEVAKCFDVTTAYKKLIEMRQRQAENLIGAQSLASGTINLGTIVQAHALGTVAPSFPNADALSVKYNLLGEVLPSALVNSFDNPMLTQGGGQVELRKVNVNVADYYTRKGCLSWMLENQGSVDHIICDPPYAIDMDMLQQENTGMDVSQTVKEHGVSDNMVLLKAFIPAAFKTIKDKGFLVMFCDAMMFKWLHDEGVAAGFKVQRWPMVWCKTQAMNQAAGYNATKATEDCIIMRKGSATIVQHQPLNWRVISKTAADKEFDHPFAKPFDLWSWVVDMCTVEGEVIYEPFAGSGSGVCSFIRKGRQWRATEIGEQHHLELLRNVARTYHDQFKGQGFEVKVHYTPKTND